MAGEQSCCSLPWTASALTSSSETSSPCPERTHRSPSRWVRLCAITVIDAATLPPTSCGRAATGDLQRGIVPMGAVWLLWPTWPCPRHPWPPGHRRPAGPDWSSTLVMWGRRREGVKWIRNSSSGPVVKCMTHVNSGPRDLFAGIFISKTSKGPEARVFSLVFCFMH
jgi:hypothetical protein